MVWGKMKTPDKDFHIKRAARGREMRIAFANAYNRLLREKIKNRLTGGGIKVRAATLAGFGKGSYSEKSAYKTRRTMASKMMKDPLVIQELLSLGLKPGIIKPNEWEIMEAPAEYENEIS